MTWRSAALVVGSALALALALGVSAGAQSGYVPVRVFQTAHNRFADLEVLLSEATRADVMLVGELHDDPNTHRLELALLEGLALRRAHVALALEMFDRDVQEPLVRFIRGELSESDFLKVARPWPQYETGYKPLVDFAVAHRWPVIAANAPRELAAEVTRGGLAVLANRPDAERTWFARDVECPLRGANYDRFKRVMSGHDPSTGTDGMDTETLDRYYLAQCLKDETMGESVAFAHAAVKSTGNTPLVVSINGSFHSDTHGGLVDSIARRLSGSRVLVATIQPVGNLDTLAPSKQERQRADFVIYTTRARTLGPVPAR